MVYKWSNRAMGIVYSRLFSYYIFYGTGICIRLAIWKEYTNLVLYIDFIDYADLLLNILEKILDFVKETKSGLTHRGGIRYS